MGAATAAALDSICGGTRPPTEPTEPTEPPGGLFLGASSRRYIQILYIIQSLHVV